MTGAGALQFLRIPSKKFLSFCLVSAIGGSFFQLNWKETKETSVFGVFVLYL